MVGLVHALYAALALSALAPGVSAHSNFTPAGLPVAVVNANVTDLLPMTKVPLSSLINHVSVEPLICRGAGLSAMVLTYASHWHLGDVAL